MNLSSDLIEQFVKATNDKHDAKSETTVYGTIVEVNSAKFVKIDGSTLMTPISTTANVKSGERVTVMIKNHTAIVTGNITSPSARVKDVEGLESAAEMIAQFEVTLNQAKEKLDALSKDNISINDSLKGISNDIDTLQAFNLTIADRLSGLEHDSGWQELPLQNGISQSDFVSANPAKYRKLRNRVSVVGTVNCVCEGASSTTIGILPDRCKPTATNSISSLIKAEGAKFAMLEITKDGSINVKWIFDLLSGALCATPTWIDMNIEFFID